MEVKKGLGGRGAAGKFLGPIYVLNQESKVA